ncbi:MAG TPA: maleylpyruvate isomerase N-terminal domain-containing protein, partial [Thermomicrobiales bacterium]|nr:maleylpyruvate isomerase N-terminal domain-containing protein [Thermomicrobiales bacterium]
AGDLAWDCRRTLDHIADSLAFYALLLATRATARKRPPRNGDPARSPAELLDVVEGMAAVLSEVARAAPAGARSFHPAGMGDAEGFVAMGCEEILIHADDIAAGLGLPFAPPADLAERVVRRLFPWAPTDRDPWRALRWACGRTALPDRPRLGPDWWVHCAPLAEWDGTIKMRTSPPAWT